MPLQPASAIGTDLGAHGDQSSLIGFTGALAMGRQGARRRRLVHGSVSLRIHPVNREIRKEKHFPFVICDLSFVIAGGDLNSTPDEKDFRAMINLKSQMTNDKWISSSISRFTGFRASVVCLIVKGLSAFLSRLRH
jgi:hypothetical protein